MARPHAPDDGRFSTALGAPRVRFGGRHICDQYRLVIINDAKAYRAVNLLRSEYQHLVSLNRRVGEFLHCASARALD
jgi:hypothetical protein